jgi:excisionase family DNA binding protein
MAFIVAPAERAQMRKARQLMADETVTASEAARRLHVHRNTMYRLLAEQALPLRALKVGSVWRIAKADLDALLAELEKDS